MAQSIPPGTTGEKVPDDSAGVVERRDEPLLVEVAWEVCNQVGGIYTVLRSKVPSMVSVPRRWSSSRRHY
jgi:hypothetical protein